MDKQIPRLDILPEVQIPGRDWALPSSGRQSLRMMVPLDQMEGHCSQRRISEMQGDCCSPRNYGNKVKQMHEYKAKFSPWHFYSWADGLVMKTLNK